MQKAASCTLTEQSGSRAVTFDNAKPRLNVVESLRNTVGIAYVGKVACVEMKL